MLNRKPLASRLWSRLFSRSEFSRHVVTLATGTTIAQAIPLAITPILSRLYTPAEFGVFALFLSLLAVLSAAGTARYELAVILPDQEEDADALVWICLGVALLVSLVTLVLAVLFNTPIARMLGNPRIGPWLYAIPFGIMLTSSFNTLNYWMNRRKKYRLMGESRIVRSGTTGVTSLGLGWAQAGAGGLIFGNLIGQAAATGMLASRFARRNHTLPFASMVQRMPNLLARYKNHPRHLLPAHWVGAAAIQLPTFIISNSFGAVITGFYALAFRVISLPASDTSGSAHPGQILERVQLCRDILGECPLSLPLLPGVWRRKRAHWRPPPFQRSVSTRPALPALPGERLSAQTEPPDARTGRCRGC